MPGIRDPYFMAARALTQHLSPRESPTSMHRVHLSRARPSNTCRPVNLLLNRPHQHRPCSPVVTTNRVPLCLNTSFGTVRSGGCLPLPPPTFFSSYTILGDTENCFSEQQYLVTLFVSSTTASYKGNTVSIISWTLPLSSTSTSVATVWWEINSFFSVLHNYSLELHRSEQLVSFIFRTDHCVISFLLRKEPISASTNPFYVLDL